MAFPNRTFYGGLLKAHPSVRNHTVGSLAGFKLAEALPDRWRKIADPSIPVCFLHVESGRESKIPGSFSYFNRAEVQVVLEVLEVLLSCKLFPDDIGIISPYEQQVNELKGMLAAIGVDIKTVDGYQGREKEIIILSLVRANAEGVLGFLTDFRRLNVAVTRARRKLIIVGNREPLGSNDIYRKMLDLIETQLTITSS
jgi:superfamily I DNA and/or RNA helicase